MSDTKAAILTALKALDPKNDDHWTSDGLPRLDAIKVSGVKRGDVTDAAPNFTRENPTLEAPAPAADPSGPTAQGAEAAPTPEADQAQGGGDDGDDGDEGDEGDDAQAADADDASDPARQDRPADEGDEDDELDPLPGDDELDEAEAAVMEAKAVLEEAQSKANAAKKVVDTAQAEHDRLVELRDAQRNPHADMEERLAFIHRQQAERARRAGVAQETLKGLNLDNLDPRSPLDRSMARKKGFGHRPRPARPLNKGE